MTSPVGADVGPVDVTVTTPSGTSTTSVGSTDDFTYLAAPTVTFVSPSIGPPAGGSTVTLTGTGFVDGDTLVNFGANSGNTITVTSPTSLTVHTPAGDATTSVDVTVTTMAGTSDIDGAGNDYTYGTPPTIINLTPASGPLGGSNAVTITGTGLVDGAIVNFGDNAATDVTLTIDNDLTVVVPAGTDTGSVDVTVTTPTGGTSSPDSQSVYDYLAPPTVTAVTPNNGALAGGNSVTITGSGFDIGVVAVNFGTTVVPIGDVLVTNDTELVVDVPATDTAGAVDVTVTTNRGTSYSGGPDDNYTYIEQPTVTQIDPNSGRLAGGAGVIITGSGFVPGDTTVNFGTITVDSSNITVDSYTQLTVLTPNGSEPGPVEVTVTNDAGTSTITTGITTYTYLSPPTIATVNPNSGVLAGGNDVTVTGTGFVIDGTSISFGSTAATAIVTSDASLTVAVPAGNNAGPVDVRVTTIAGTSDASTTDDDYTYLQGPTITGIDPASGAIAGGNTVDITGTGFTVDSIVTFGTLDLPDGDVAFNSDTGLSVLVPPGPAGTIDVTVTTDLGTSNGASYTYVDIPTITSVEPNFGLLAGNETVTITGSGFVPGLTVNFGPSAVAPDFITVDSDTQLTVLTPTGDAPGTVAVTITNPAGTSALVPGITYYTYLEPPTVASVQPASGVLAGGNNVTITGTGFEIDATTVRFGTTSATAVVVADDETLTADVPAGATSGAVNVSVITDNGTSDTSGTDDNYTYLALPTVTSIGPSSGALVGGNPVIVLGTGFTVGTSVSFGTIVVPGSNIDVSSDTSLTVTAPVSPDVGPVHVTVTTDAGSSITSDDDVYTYLPLPTVTDVDPASGALGGGNTVIITGTGFVAGTTVNFGPFAVTGPVTFDGDTEMSVSAPASTGAGALHVTVTNGGGTSIETSEDGYFYLPLPTVTNVDPDSGVLAGGNNVTISGSGFTGATVVMFGATSSAFSIVDDTTIGVTAPAGSAGTVHVTVTAPGGSSTATVADQYTYVADPQSIQIAVQLDTGESIADATVVVHGEGLAPSSEVRIELHSTPVLLGTAITDSSGTLDTTVRLPHVVSPGTHNIVVLGTGPEGELVEARHEVFVDWSGALGDVHPSGGYTPLTATRILDTRNTQSMAAATEFVLAVPSGLVPSDATGLVLNVAVTNARGAGFLTIYPCGTARPLAAALNFVPGEIKANLVDAIFRDGGTLCMWSNVALDAVVDLQGFHSDSGNGKLVPRTAVRLLDSRPDDALMAGQVLQIPVIGEQAAPIGTSTVALNIAVDDPQQAGFLTVYPCGTARPLASNLNFAAGQTVSNEVMVQPGADGMVCVYTMATTHLVVDLDGTFQATGSSRFSPLIPGRFADTRAASKPLAGQTMEWTVAGVDGAPIGTTAVSLNIAVTEPEGPGFLTVYPCGAPRPLASNLNFAGGQTISNHVTATLGENGKLCVFTSRSANIVIDIEGIYSPV